MNCNKKCAFRLSKTHGMGLSIVAAKGVGKDCLGIYIKVSRT